MPVVEGLEQPVLALAPLGSRPLHVVDQVGRIVTARGDVVLDIIDRVPFQGEQGLLGLAFPDDYADHAAGSSSTTSTCPGTPRCPSSPPGTRTASG